jgi:hypothetical protein
MSQTKNVLLENSEKLLNKRISISGVSRDSSPACSLDDVSDINDADEPFIMDACEPGNPRFSEDRVKSDFAEGEEGEISTGPESGLT